MITEHLYCSIPLCGAKLQVAAVRAGTMVVVTPMLYGQASAPAAVSVTIDIYMEEASLQDSIPAHSLIRCAAFRPLTLYKEDFAV